MTRDWRSIVAIAILGLTATAIVCYNLSPGFAHWTRTADGRYWIGLATGASLTWQIMRKRK